MISVPSALHEFIKDFLSCYGSIAFKLYVCPAVLVSVGGDSFDDEHPSIYSLTEVKGRCCSLLATR